MALSLSGCSDHERHRGRAEQINFCKKLLDDGICPVVFSRHPTGTLTHSYNGRGVLSIFFATLSDRSIDGWEIGSKWVSGSGH